MLFTIFLIASLLRGTLAQGNPSALANHTRAFSDAQVVPDVLVSFNPTALLDVVYTDPVAKESLKVSPGIQLTPEQTPNTPRFFLSSDDASVQEKAFVLVMVDPDAPSPANRSLAQIRHLMAGDFRLDKDMGQPMQLLNTSAAISEYVGPAPPAGSDPHRYVILVYVQPAGFANTASTFANATGPITNFNLTTFVTSAQLGNPVAGTFFLAGPSAKTNSDTTTSPGTKASGSAPAPRSNGAFVGRQAVSGMTGILGLTFAGLFA